MKVKNINGTSDNACKCDNWLDHWKRFSGRQLPPFCPENTCSQKPEVGGHVQKDNPADNSWYIMPLCKMHNSKKGGDLDVSDNVKLVSANVKEMCGK